MSSPAYDPELYLEEHWTNPLCRALGPQPSFSELHDQMQVSPPHSPEDRRRRPHLRRSATLRLFQVMVPTERQIELGERIHQIIRLGYQHRDASKGDYRTSYLASARAVELVKEGGSAREAQALFFSNPDIIAPGLTLLGGPGMGKTRSVNRIIMKLCKPVKPDIDEDLIQLPVVKLECPSKGGRAALCLSIAAALDKALGTTYHSELERGRVSGDHLLVRVQHLLNLHAVGLLIIDEIQHLQQSSEGIPPVMGFLVTLVNLLGIPVMLIGTNDAHKVIQSSFREARRAAGLGQPNWNRMDPDAEWDEWLNQVWNLQYTATPTALDEDLRCTIYDLSQGVIDIAIKLIVLTQIRAITAGGDELMTPQLFRQVAADEFGCVSTMIEGLRTGNMKILSQFPDLKPLSAHVEEVLSRATGRSIEQVQRILAMQSTLEVKTATERDDPATNIKAFFLADGHEEVEVDAALAEAVAELGDAPWMAIGLKMKEMLARVAEPIAEEATPPSGADIGNGLDGPASGATCNSVGGTGAPRKKKTPVLTKSELPADSLLKLAEGVDDVHEALTKAGVVKSPRAILKSG